MGQEYIFKTILSRSVKTFLTCNNRKKHLKTAGLVSLFNWNILNMFFIAVGIWSAQPNQVKLIK